LDASLIKRCGVCKLVRYCGKECQSNDWKDHKTRCKAPNPKAKIFEFISEEDFKAIFGVEKEQKKEEEKK